MVNFITIIVEHFFYKMITINKFLLIPLLLSLSMFWSLLVLI